MMFKKTIALGLASVLLAAAAYGCTEKNAADTEGGVTVSIGNWPGETDVDALEVQNARVAKMKEVYPDITIVPDTYRYDTQTFTMKASANQLPDAYNTWFTEIKQIIKAGYAADITDNLKKIGILDAMNPTLLELVTDDDGRVYGLPTSAYAQGLAINKAMFKEAGLVNEDGSVKIPDSYQELAEFAQIIHEKTGKAGYAIPTIDNCGGWHFLNIAWSYGVDFMEQNDDGSWTATFNSPEMIEALQYIKDLKWKYNAIPDNTVINADELSKLFSTNQAAMIFISPTNANAFTRKYNMELEDIMMARMPKGPAGRYTQMGGDLVMFSKNATSEKIDAALKWYEFIGYGAEFTDEMIENSRKSLALDVENNSIVMGSNPFPLWVDEERLAKEKEIAAEYINVDLNDYNSYLEFKDVTLREEEPVACQQLYSVLDKCIQEVITNQNADIAEIVAIACNDFQVNHLDKAE